MIKSGNRRVTVVFAMLILLSATAFFANILIGNVNIGLDEVVRILFAGGGDIKSRNIIASIRLPRTVMTFVLGGALAVSGFLLQTYFANPIAGPYILGISSGAKMAVAMSLIFITAGTGYTSNLMLVMTAFVGAMAATGFIILISKRVRNMAALLAAGIMIGYICSAVTDFLVTFADDSDIVNLHSWSQGSFSGATMSAAWFSTCIVGVVFVAVMLMSKVLDAFRLGEV